MLKISLGILQRLLLAANRRNGLCLLIAAMLAGRQVVGQLPAVRDMVVLQEIGLHMRSFQVSRLGAERQFRPPNAAVVRVAGRLNVWPSRTPF